MTGLEALLTVAGAAATLLMIAGMILLTPPGEVDRGDRANRASGLATRRVSGGPERMTRARRCETRADMLASPGKDLFVEDATLCSARRLFASRSSLNRVRW
jgi:hypothetical protein